MDPFEHLRTLRRRWLLVAVVTALSLAAAGLLLLTGDAPRSGLAPAAAYRADNTLLQAPGTPTEIDLKLVRLYAMRGDVPRRAAQMMGLPKTDGPREAALTTFTVDPDVAALTISSTDTDPDRAALRANAFAAALKERLRGQASDDRAAEVERVQTQSRALQAQVLALSGELSGSGVRRPLVQAELDGTAARYQALVERLQVLQEQDPATAGLVSLEEATAVPLPATGNPVPTSPAGRLLLAGLLGLALGCGLALLVDRLDVRLRRREQVEDVAGLPVVAEVPRLPREQRRMPQVLMAAEPAGAVAEAYRALRSTLLLVPAKVLGASDAPPVDLATWSPPRVVLVTSPGASEGKTSTVVNLATALAESGRSVIVIDADFRRPTAHACLGVAAGPGLSELLAGTLAGGVAAALRETAVRDVRLITSGNATHSPAALLARFGEVVEQAVALADVVIVDSPPLLVANDATDIVPHAEAVLLVAHAGRTTRPQVQRTVGLLTRFSVPVLGVVLQASRQVDARATADYYGAPAGQGGSRAVDGGAPAPRPVPEAALEDRLA